MNVVEFGHAPPHDHVAGRRIGGPVEITADPVRWLETVVEAAQNSGGNKLAVMVVQLPGGARVEVEDEKQAALAAALLRALARTC